jgi:hypothetical protein
MIDVSVQVLLDQFLMVISFVKGLEEASNAL